MGVCFLDMCYVLKGIFQFKDLFFYQKERKGTGIIVFGFILISYDWNFSGAKKTRLKRFAFYYRRNCLSLLDVVKRQGGMKFKTKV